MIGAIKSGAVTVGGHLVRNWGKYLVGAAAGTGTLIAWKKKDALRAYFQRDLDSTRIDLEAVRKHREEVIQQRDAALAQRDEALSRVANADQTISELNAQLLRSPSMSEEITKLQTELAKARAEVSAATQKVAELARELEAGKIRETNLRTREIELTEKVDGLQKEVKQLSLQLADAETALEAEPIPVPSKGVIPRRKRGNGHRERGTTEAKVS